MHIVNTRTIISEAPLLCAISVAVVAVSAIIHFIILPVYSDLLTRQAELAHYQSKISSESGYQLLKKEISDKIDTLRGRLRPLPDQKKVTSDPGSYLEMLIAVARKADIRFVRMQPQEETHTADLTHYPVLLVLTTTYHELGQFISAIEKMPFMFTVNRLAIEATKQGKCEVKLLVTCQIPKE